MKPIFICVCLALITSVSAQLTTSDIPNFYRAFDALAEVETRTDSVSVFQREYLDSGSEGLRLFAKVRDVNAEALVSLVARFPKYYASIRPTAMAVAENEAAIAAVLQEVATVLPDFEVPPVTIAFGVLNTGGTVSKGHILLGAGMNCGGGTGVDVSELPDYLAPFVIGNAGLGDIATLAAHEAVHTWQRGFSLNNLVKGVINEGVCDFVVYDLMGRPANDVYHVYGAANECEVWRKFKVDLDDGGKGARDNWLYNGHVATPEWPGDMGYFVGRRIAAAYYAQAEDKAAALRALRRVGRYKRVLRESGYDGGCGG